MRSAAPSAHEISGAAPAAVLRPRSREELCEALRAASRERRTIVPWGGGVALAREPAPARYDLALDLGALDRVVEYQPEDMTLTAECGATIASLRALLAARGQELPLEAAHAARATLGGALAANAAGPRRRRFGAPRDRILGARFALADGTLVRTGGRVVKNVAGFGIHRLLCGSRGGLAVLVEASLKLAPGPERREALLYRLPAASLADPRPWRSLPRLEPAFVTVISPEVATDGEVAAAFGAGPPPREWRVAIGLEDDAAWVEQQAAAVEAALGAPAARLEGEAAAALVQNLADLEESAGARLGLVTAAGTPAALAPLLDRPAARRLVFHALAGRLLVFPEAAEAQAAVAELGAHGFAAVDRRGVDGLDPPIPPPAVRALRARLRAALDPGRAMALGDRWEETGG